jgi:hypothetical protein
MDLNSSTHAPLGIRAVTSYACNPLSAGATCMLRVTDKVAKTALSPCIGYYGANLDLVDTLLAVMMSGIIS